MNATRLRLLDSAACRSAAFRAADGLPFAAAPTFAFLALVTGGQAPALCALGPGLPIDGMTAMSLLMSLFQLSPWVTLARRRWATGR